LKERFLGRRALAEFFIVVVGILSALALDSAVQSRDDRRAERQYLGALRLAMETDTVSLNPRPGDGGRVLLDWLIEIQTAPVIDTVEALGQLRLLTFFATLPPRDGVFQELTSTGGLDLIRNVDLRRAIVSYYAWLDHIQPLEDYMEQTGTLESRADFLQHIDPVAWARLGIVYAERRYQPDEDDVEELRRQFRVFEGGVADFDALGRDPRVRARIATIAENRAIQALLYRQVVDLGRAALQLIDDEIGPSQP